MKATGGGEGEVPRVCSDCGKPLAPWQHDGCCAEKPPSTPSAERLKQASVAVGHGCQCACPACVRVALALEEAVREGNDVIRDLRQKLAIAGVEGSPPPFEATIPRLIREKRELTERLRAVESALAAERESNAIACRQLAAAESALVAAGDVADGLSAEIESMTKERDEARGHAANHHLEACETCIANESETISVRQEREKLAEALEEVVTMRYAEAADYRDVARRALAALRLSPGAPPSEEPKS
jgi:hypothetical protein